MIIAFESKESDVLNRFVSSYSDPDSLFSKLRHAYEYTSKKFYRIDDFYIFQFDSILNIIAKRALIVTTCFFFMSYVLEWRTFSILSLIVMFMSMFILSKAIKQFIWFCKLKFSGHREKISFVSNDFLLNKLLMEFEDGSAGSLRKVKE